MPDKKKSQKDASDSQYVSLGLSVDPVPYQLFFITYKSLLKFGIKVKIVIIIIKMLYSDRNKKLYAQFLTAFITGFVMFSEVLHSLVIKLFIYEGRYVAFKFFTVQKPVLRTLAYTVDFTTKQAKNTDVNEYITINMLYPEIRTLGIRDSADRQNKKWTAALSAAAHFLFLCRQWDLNPHTVARGRF